LVVAAAVGLDATYFHGSAATSIQRDARGGGRGFSKGGGSDFLEPCLSAWAAMLIAKAFVMSSHTNSHPTMVLCYI